MKLSLNRWHLLTIELTHLQNVSRQGLPSARIFGMPTSPNPFTTVQFNTTDDDATTPSSITTSVHDTSTAGTPTPTDPDLDKRVRDVLSHIFGEAHANGESDKLIASVTKQAASQHREWSQPKAQDVPAADLRKMLSQHQGRDKASVMINGVEYIAKIHDIMYQVSNHKQTALPLALIDRGANGGRGVRHTA
jgi:hypothetical protein